MNYTLSNSIAYPPESMVGGLGMSISACSQWMFLFLRYRFIELKVPQIKRVNYITYLVGCISALGMMGVGSFQWTNDFIVHTLCANVTFVGYNMYLLINTWYIDPLIEEQ